MARSQLTVQSISRDGLVNPTYTAADINGMAFDNTSKRVVIHVDNGGGSSINVTIITRNTIDGLAVSDRVVAVPNGESRFIGPFPADIYNGSDPDTSLAQAVQLDFSAITSVTLAAFKLPAPTY